MDAKLQRRIQRYGWDKAADAYESGWAEQLRPSHERLLEAARLRPGEHVLDVACGTGIVTLAAAWAVGQNGGVLGVDVSERMIAVAREAAGACGASNVRFERDDAESLATVDTSFDACLCALGLMYVPEPEAALQRMLARLRPGGRLVVSVWGRRDRCGWAALFPIVDARVRSEVCPMFFRLGTGDVLRDALLDCGFVDVVCDRMPATLRYRDAEAACDAAFDGGPVAMAWARFDEHTREAARTEYLESIAAWRDGYGYAIPGEFVIAAGRRPVAPT